VLHAIGVDSLGRIVVAGGSHALRASPDVACTSAIVLARLLKDGRFDPEFGDNGHVDAAFGGVRRASAEAMALQGDAVTWATGYVEGEAVLLHYRNR
jgi:hypothetical protein